MNKTACLVMDAYYYNGLCFDASNTKANRDDCLYVWRNLKEVFAKHGVTLLTEDALPRQIADYVLYSDVQPHILQPLPTPEEVSKSYLLAFESQLIRPENYEKSVERFHKVFTWRDDLVNNHKYFKFNFSQEIKTFFEATPEFVASKHGLCSMIAGNKTVKHPLELYSHRVQAIRWFEEKASQDFDLYGVGWEEGIMLPIPWCIRFTKRFPVVGSLIRKNLHRRVPSYKGKVDSKYQTLAGYKFAICYENAHGIEGYITEKIIDCFKAGCVPIYWGASNITDYIPEACFVDKTKFSSMEALHRHITQMPAMEYLNYLKAIKAFMESSQAQAFDSHFVNQIIVKEILKSS